MARNSYGDAPGAQKQFQAGENGPKWGPAAARRAAAYERREAEVELSAAESSATNARHRALDDLWLVLVCAWGIVFDLEPLSLLLGAGLGGLLSRLTFAWTRERKAKKLRAQLLELDG